MPTLTPEEVARRYRQAKERRAPWESHWSEWYWFDLIFGLTLNSVSEELVDRGIVAAILLRHGLGAGIVILVSALLFGSAHWSKGLPNIVVAVLYGILFMTMYLKTRSIWPGVAVHTIDNVTVFA